METIFVSENLIDTNHWTNDNNQKLKIGEIFQLQDSTLSLCCTNCSQEFQYFTEFSLHIQEHYLRGEIAQLKGIKEEISIEEQNDTQEEEEKEEEEEEEFQQDVEATEIIPEVKCEVVHNNADDFFFNNDSDFAWSDDGTSLFEQINQSIGKMSETIGQNNMIYKQQSFVEGIDYEKIDDKFKCLTCYHVIAQLKHLKEHLLAHTSPKDVMCPICSKLFTTISYVRKHVNRTHNMRITAEEIKQAQPTTHGQSMNSFTVDHRLPPVSNPSLNTAELKAKSEPQKRIYTDGIDYQKVGDKFECLRCNRQMAKLDHMREHVLTHTNEKNVLCPICARAFITEAYVRKHVNRTHKQRITSEEIKAAQPGIDVMQKQQEYAAIEREKEMTKNLKSMKSTTPCAEGAVQCLMCEKWFTKARYAQKHMRLIHAKIVTIQQLIIGQQSVATIDTDNVDNDYSNEMNVELKTETKEVGSETVVKNFECFECHKQFVSQNSVRIHMKLHSGIKYACPHCAKLFAMKSYVLDHITIMHGISRKEIPKESILQASGNYIYTPRYSASNIEAYECYLCHNQYRKRNRLREHMNTHISGPFLCVICGAVYKSTDTLRHHMEKHKANPDEPHQCSACGKLYRTRRYMLSHYRTIHLNKRRKKVFPEKTIEDIACEVCDKKFLNRHNLKMHMTVHTRDPNELICQICGWEFKERSNLRQHMESHGNNKTNCKVCNKVLSIRYIQEHMKIHDGNKEFQCSVCGKQFVNRERLKRHMVRHSGEAKFVCDLCPRAYTRSDKLLYHRRTHEQQMKNTCQTCGLGFLSPKSLRKHENKHYREDQQTIKTE